MALKELVIRPSTVGSFMLCPARPGYRGEYGYNYIPNRMLLFGSTMHWIIEQELIGKEWSMSSIMLEMASIFEKDQPNESEKIHLADVMVKADRVALAAEAVKAVALWSELVAPSLPESEPHVEERLEAVAFEDKRYKVTVSGTPDVFWPQEVLMVDWKSAGQMWKPEKAEGQVQPVAYPWMAKQSGYDIRKFIFWVYDRKTEWWGKFERQKSKVLLAEDAFKRQAFAAAVAIEEGTWGFTPAGQGYSSRGWHCQPRYCDAWKCCVGKHLIADGKQNEKALTIKERMK